MRTLLKSGMRPLTAEAFYRLPESAEFCELIEGELVMPPSPDPLHQTITGTLFGELYMYLRDRPLGAVYHAPLDVELSPVNVYQPDVLFVFEGRKDRVKRKRIRGRPGPRR